MIPARETAVSMNAMENAQEYLNAYKPEHLSKEIKQLNQGGEVEIPNLYCLVDCILTKHQNISQYMEGTRKYLLGGTNCETVEECNFWYQEFQTLMLELLGSSGNTKLNIKSLKTLKDQVGRNVLYCINPLIVDFFLTVNNTMAERGPISPTLDEFLDEAVVGEMLEMVYDSRKRHATIEAISDCLEKYYYRYKRVGDIPDDETMIREIGDDAKFIASFNEPAQYMQFRILTDPEIPRNNILLGSVGRSVVYSENLLFDVEYAPAGQYYQFPGPWPGKAKAKGKYKLELANHTVVIPEVFVVSNLLINSISIGDFPQQHFITVSRPFSYLVDMNSRLGSVVAAGTKEDPRPFLVSSEESRRFTSSREAQDHMRELRV